MRLEFDRGKEVPPKSLVDFLKQCWLHGYMQTMDLYEKNNRKGLEWSENRKQGSTPYSHL